MSEDIERLRAKLLRQRHLFDDPAAYAAGVLDALDALVEVPEGTTDGDRSEQRASLRVIAPPAEAAS
jgi:hypothetical protein